MVFGIGVDIVKVERVKEAVQRWGDKFTDRLFTQGELSYCFGRHNPYISLSARFAAKEAVVKAISSGIPFSFREAEVVNSPGGQPILKVRGRLAEFLKEKGVVNIHLSLSHENEFAVAYVLLEKND